MDTDTMRRRVDLGKSHDADVNASHPDRLIGCRRSPPLFLKPNFFCHLPFTRSHRTFMGLRTCQICVEVWERVLKKWGVWKSCDSDVKSDHRSDASVNLIQEVGVWGFIPLLRRMLMFGTWNSPLTQMDSDVSSLETHKVRVRATQRNSAGREPPRLNRTA